MDICFSQQSLFFKDMERWAKNLNQKKESNRSLTINDIHIQSNGMSTASADIGFAVLEKKNTSTPQLNFAAQKPEVVYTAAKAQVRIFFFFYFV